jgi:hypothetical protein
MRPYERLRAGELAGTVGSRAPSFPIQRDGDVSLASFRAGVIVPPIRTGDPEIVPEAARLAPCAPVTCPQTEPSVFETEAETAPLTGILESIPPPTSNDGIWIEFQAVRWFSAGPAVSFDPDRFQAIGAYRGFPVYRERDAASNTIYVTVVADGPIAPYRRR